VDAVLTVQDVMTTSVISVETDTPLKEVASMLVEHGISGLPVVDAERRVVGVVSETDLVLKETGADAVPHRALERLRGESKATRSYRTKLGATTASEAMTAPAITIRASRSLAEAARLMTRHGVNRLVVEDDGRIVGIVTRADLVRAYVRSDDELADTIRKEVLWRSMWLDPAGFTVSVRQGIAHIRGHVDRRSMADLVKHSVAMVPGIVDVRADVTWAFDDSQVQPAAIDPHFPFSPR
jgi:CBS domain-containing protein